MTEARKNPIGMTGEEPDPWSPRGAADASEGGPVGVEPVPVGVEPPPVVVALTRTFLMLAEQMTSAPPPLAEPLHWLIVTPWDEGFVPLAVHLSWTSVPPLAEPLHCVIVAPVVVAGKGSQPMVMLPEPTHWLTVAAVAPVFMLTKSLVTLTLQRTVAPPPLSASLHWVTLVTSLLRFHVVTLHEAVGAPAAP
jgi:hypothetical protein